MIPRHVRVLVLYDCLYPWTVGGAERWYRHVAIALAADGHEVTYATRRQWDRGAAPDDLPGVRVVAISPRMGLYTASGRRRTDEALWFGAGTLWHLLRHGRRYDVVHTASFPYFSLLAAGALRPLGRYRLVVDWHELWTRSYWLEYLGGLGGRVGLAVQRLGLRIRQRAFCFAQLTARRLREEGVHGDVVVLEGQWEGPLEPAGPAPAQDVAVFAGRLIAEKRADALGPALTWARRSAPGLRGEVYGDGPERPAVERAAAAEPALAVRGFVDAAELDAALARALCVVLPSRREGYGKIVIEAARLGVPSVVVDDPDSAAVELVQDGVNGVLAASASAADLGAALLRVRDAGPALRDSTAAWFAEHAERLSLDASLRVLLEAYAR
jgi:glycosyltransferase involved in cell wall biosynthesis